MPRANRFFLEGYVWHITHRCHGRDFLLRFARDRRRWVYWLFEARRRFGLCVLNYIATSNHIHLLVRARGGGEIARSMQLVASRTAQEYNRRKGRLGAYWQDRYHATAVDTGDHLVRCLVYIDLNMVRAGVVAHPRDWAYGGYQEIQSPPQRYWIVDRPALMQLLQLRNAAELQRRRAEWVNAALDAGPPDREDLWTGALAVGGRTFVDRVKAEIGAAAQHRDMGCDGDTHWVNEQPGSYTVDFGDGIGHPESKDYFPGG